MKLWGNGSVGCLYRFDVELRLEGVDELHMRPVGVCGRDRHKILSGEREILVFGLMRSTRQALAFPHLAGEQSLRL